MVGDDELPISLRVVELLVDPCQLIILLLFTDNLVHHAVGKRVYGENRYFGHVGQIGIKVNAVVATF
jgi:hypothetical protein